LRSGGERAGHVASIFVQIPRDLAGKSVPLRMQFSWFGEASANDCCFTRTAVDGSGREAMATSDSEGWLVGSTVQIAFCANGANLSVLQIESAAMFTEDPDLIQALVQEGTGIHADVFKRVNAAYPYGIRLWDGDTGTSRASPPAQDASAMFCLAT
jgi:hypothetical protein